jgi:NAD(P)-dependent dehydrogenase (short-subunit alcohol dehydrogenase family)
MNIVVTGASSGVGFETALQLVSNIKNKVVALARSADKLQKLSQLAIVRNPDGILFPLKFDIVHGDYDNVLIPFLEKNLGQIDVIVNNAGALINKPFKELHQLDFVSMLQTNFLAPVKIIQHLLPLISARGGHIVNIGSMGGLAGSIKFPGLAAYSASKGALHTLTECLAVELEQSNIKVNCLALGSAQTEMLEKAFPGYSSPVLASDMGRLVADFAITGHKFFNGKILPVSVTTP